MNHAVFARAALVALTGALTAGRAAAQPSITPLPNAYPYGVSGSGGTPVGVRTVGATAIAFRWPAGAGVQTLGTLPGTAESTAFNASWDGNVVVGGSGPLYQNSTRAFVWRAGTGMSEILPTGGFNGMQAHGVSDDGSTVVGTMGGFNTGKAFRWTAGGGVQNLGVLPGSTGFGVSLGTDVSADGSVVVGMSSAAVGNRAFRWTAATGMVDLGLFPGGTSSQAQAVSGDGSVVVGSNATATHHRAFRWTEAGGMIDLGVLPSFNESVAYGVSGDGAVVVGTCQLAGTGVPPGAFVWTQQTGLRPLSVFLADAGVNLAGWSTIQNAFAISHDGLTITGWGVYQGVSHGFVAVIPAPGGALLAAAWLPFALRRRGRAGPRSITGG